MIAAGSKLVDITLIKCLLIQLSSFGSAVLLSAQLLVIANTFFFLEYFQVSIPVFIVVIFEDVEMKYVSCMKSQHFYQGIGLSLISANQRML